MAVWSPLLQADSEGPTLIFDKASLPSHSATVAFVAHDFPVLGFAMCPGNMHQSMMMDFPVSMGGYEYTKTPDDPCIIQMVHCPYGQEGAPAEEQYAEARYRMLGLQFQDYEDEIRTHLTGMFPKDLFNFDRDIASISVNRWAHGYANGGPGDSTEKGRQPFHRITVANSDSAPGADSWVAVRMAIRAVNELG